MVGYAGLDAIHVSITDDDSKINTRQLYRMCGAGPATGADRLRRYKIEVRRCGALLSIRLVVGEEGGRPGGGCGAAVLEAKIAVGAAVCDRSLPL